jgi:hypothetical protein
MAIHELRANPDVFDGLHPINDDDWDLVKFWGEPIAATWTPVAVKIDPVPRKHREQAHSDYPSLADPVVTEHALTVLRPLIADSVEILPLAYPHEPLYALNVVRVLDCLDDDRLVYHEGTTIIEKYAFKPGSTEGQHIFKIKRLLSRVFVSEEFKRRVDDAGLLGFHFFAVDPDGSLREIPLRLPPGTRRRTSPRTKR